jgi:hypothetical protein
LFFAFSLLHHHHHHIITHRVALTAGFAFIQSAFMFDMVRLLCIFAMVLFSISWSSALDGNYFETIEKMFINEEGRQATNVLQEDLAGGFDSPKEISITYNTVIIIFYGLSS